MSAAAREAVEEAAKIEAAVALAEVAADEDRVSARVAMEKATN